MKVSKFRLFVLIVVAVLVMLGIGFCSSQVYKTLFPQQPNQTTNSQAPTQQPVAPTTAPQTGGNNVFPTPIPQGNGAVQPTNPTSAPVIPAQPGSYPLLSCDGSKPVLRVAFDAYAGFYPLIYQIMTAPANSHYCLEIYPKWMGADYSQNGWSEAEIENKLKSGELDVYFASNGALALYDGNSGLVVWSTDQSSGADQIWARNSIKMPDEKKPSFNDIMGRSLVISKGNADHFLAIKMMQTVGLTPDMVTIIDSGSPVSDFVAGQGEVVAYWDPVIRDANMPDTTLLVSTKWWRTISDYVVISHNADQTKSDAVLYFLNDYLNATAGFTKDRLPETAQTLSTFTLNGEDMAYWTMIDKADPYGSLNSLLDGVAIATLNDNAIMFQIDPTGSNLVIDQLIRSNKTWQFGGIYDNGNAGSLFNAPALVTDKYVQTLLAGNALQVRGEFNNTYDTSEQTKPPVVDKDTLITLPEILTLPYKNIAFVKDQSAMLVDGEEEKLKAMIEPIANMMAESDDSVIVIRGGAGGYSSNKAQMDFIRKFAYKRAQFIQSFLANQLNIPIQRIILDPNVLVPDHQPMTEEELNQYVVVIIRVVNTNEALNK